MQATFWLVYQDSNYNDVIALFRTEAKATEFVANNSTVPGIGKVEARVDVPFEAVQEVPVTPL